MRLAAMRHAASLVLALVWAVARLAQPLNATCPHHALASIAAVTAEQRASADVHTASHAHLHDAGTGTTTPASAPAPHAPDTGCDCASACCAASVVAMPMLAEPIGVPLIAWTTRVAFTAPRAPHVRRVAHRQPPANAPPRQLLA
jgi:hypothetical protein